MFDEILATIVVTIITIIGKKVLDLINVYLNKYITDKQYDSAKEVLLAGMAKAQNEIVRELKNGALDNKLTLEDIKKVEKVAIDYAIQIADETTKKILETWTPERVSSEIKQLLSKFKK